MRFFIHSPNKYLLSTCCIPGAVTQISEANWGAVSELTTWLGRQMLIIVSLSDSQKEKQVFSHWETRINKVTAG